MRAFAAIGPHAARITADHPWDVPHGRDSPVGHVHELGSQECDQARMSIPRGK